MKYCNETDWVRMMQNFSDQSRHTLKLMYRAALLTQFLCMAPAFGQHTLSLECSFQRKTTDTIAIHNGTENRREAFLIDTTTGGVIDGGVAWLITKSANAKTTVTDTKFSGTGSGDITKDVKLTLGIYEIDRYTGNYTAKVVTAMKDFLENVRVSSMEEQGTCRPSSKKF